MSGAVGRARTLAAQPWNLAALAVVFMVLAVIAARPAGAESGSLMVSSSSDRSGATALDGATLSGVAYVFLTTTEDVQRVVFSLDGVETQVENEKPYDFVGGKPGAANPWSTSAVADGTHSISARVSLVGGGEFTVSASFTVESAPFPVASDSGTLLVSNSSNRAGPSALHGATLSGDVYPFLQTNAQVKRVDFALDGQHHWTEEYLPYDFSGGENTAANAWSTTSVDDGAHTITARITLTNDSQFSVSASFEVDNGAAGDPNAEPSPTATPVSAAATAELRSSASANRSGASALGAQVLSGDAYIFLTADTQLREVRFYVDGTFVRTELLTPYDLGGTASDNTARAWDSTTVPDGSHTLEAAVTTAAGETFSVSSSFEVDNDPVEASQSEIDSTASGAAGPSLEVFVSQSADRGGAEVFGSEPAIGEIYVFAVPSEAPNSIRFFIDPTAQPLPVQTERVTPYDLGGTRSDGAATAFDTADLAEGDHTLLVVAEYTDGEPVSKEIVFTVEHPAALPDISYELLVSESPDRSNAVPLDDADLADMTDGAYIFVSPADHVAKVSFYLDAPAQTTADRVDESVPFDLVGGSASAASPLDVEDLTAGDHKLSAVLTRTNGTTVDIAATFSKDGTILPNGAVLIRTTDNAAQIASQHGAGTTFVFESGLHRGVSIQPQSGDVFLGSPGTVLSGAKVLSGWQSASGVWYVGGQTSELTGNGGCAYYDGVRYDACHYPEQLFVDGESWWQVTSIGQLAWGKWYFDYGANRVYIGANPSGHTIELSTVPYAFGGSSSDVTISGLIVEKYANRAQTGAIDGSSSNRWTVSGNTVRLNHGYGIRTGNRIKVLNNNVHHNGQLGVGGVGDYILVEGNEIAYNHTGGFLLDWEAGGTKFALTDGLVVRDNWVHHNAGRGLWTDIDNINVLMVDNLVEYNAKGGIVHEIGYAAEFRNNVSRYNGQSFSEWEWGGQIVVQNSSDTLVINNDVTVAGGGVGNGITVINQPRGSGQYGPHVSERVTVTGNTIRMLGVSGVSGANDGCRRDITFDNNTYIAPQSWFNYWQIHWCSAYTFEQFQDAGQEANGTAIVE